METTIINFIAGPGAGKSSSAYTLAGNMKWRGFSCELVTEYAKDLVWQESLSVLSNQIYVFGKQYQRFYRLLGKVEYIITDSPLFNSIYYDGGKTPNFATLILDMIHSMKNINIFIERLRPYWEVGRLQSETDAIKIDAELLALLNFHKLPYLKVPGKEDNWEEILQYIKSH